MPPRQQGRAALAALLIPQLILAGCTSADDPPGALTRDEERQLNDAASMLDANSVALEGASDNGADRQ